jgi:hypothetical protein
MGKTVWLDLLCDQPPDELLLAKADYEGVRTTEEFLLRTIAALRDHRSVPRRAITAIGSLFDGLEIESPYVTIRKGLKPKSRTDLLSDAVRVVDQHLDGRILVIAMDEVPIAIDNIAKNEGPDAANQLLQTLREVRRRRGSIRWIVCGSIGFHHVLHRCGATEGAINDLVNLPLGPLTPEDASELFQRLLLGIEQPAHAADLDEVIAAAIAETGGVPFLLHSVAHVLHQQEATVTTPDRVRTAFAAFLDDRDGSRAVHHMVSRIDTLYGDRKADAKDLLDLVAREQELPLADLVDSTVIDDLADDHYLLVADRTVSWRYPVYRRMWLHRRGQR